MKDSKISFRIGKRMLLCLLSNGKMFAMRPSINGVCVCETFGLLCATRKLTLSSNAQDQHTTNFSLVACLGVLHFLGIRVQQVLHMPLVLPRSLILNDLTTLFPLLLDEVVDNLGKVPPHSGGQREI